MRLLTLAFLLLFFLDSYSQEAEIVIPRGHTTPVTLLDFHHKENWMASSQGDNGLTIWNFDTEKELRQLRNHSEAITALAFHPNFPFIISGDASGRLIVTDITKNRKRSDVMLHKGRINSILVPEGGHYFISCSDDSTVTKTGYVNLEEIISYKCDDRITAIEERSNTEEIIAGTIQGQVLWLGEGEIKNRLSITKGSAIRRIHSIGKELILICENGEIQKLNTKSKEITKRANSGLKIKDSRLIDNNRLVLVGRGEAEIQLLDLSTFEFSDLTSSVKLRKELDPYNLALQKIHVIQDSGILLIPDYDYSILAYDLNNQNIIRRFEGLTERVREIKIHPNGRVLALASEQNGLRLYDLAEIHPTGILDNSESSFSVDFSPLGDKMAVAYDKKLRIFDFNSREIIREFELIGAYPNGNTTFLSDNLFVKKDERDGVTLFNTSTGEKKLIKVKSGYQFRAQIQKGSLAIQSGKSSIIIFSNKKFKKQGKIKIDDIIDFDFNKSGEIVILHNRKEPSISSYDLRGKEQSTFKIESDNKPNKIQTISGTDYAATWNTAIKQRALSSNFNIEIWNLDIGERVNVLSGASSIITSLDWSEKANLIVASSEDGSVRAWPVEKKNSNFKFPVSIFPLEGKELVTIAENGVFDATRNAMQMLHYIQGKEYITLDQLKEEFYEPHLLSKVFGFNEEEVKPRSTKTRFNLYPEIKLQHPNTNGGVLGVDLDEREGGVGDVLVWINGKKAKQFASEEITEDHIKFEIAGHPFLKPNEINTISVRAKNQAGDLISREKRLRYIWNQDVKDADSKMYALIVGVSDYQGNKLDLQFASKDAMDISDALSRGASKHFGVDNVEVVTLVSGSDDKNLTPSKSNILEQMRLLAPRIKPGDVFLFYFAGHGMQGNGDEKHYYLITQEASKNDTRTMEEPQRFSISDSELAEMLTEISSNNMIMILDACHSGEMINRFNRSLGHMSSEEVRTLEKLMDETGMYILAGSESDDVSYETSLYGQGLLTYSLLFGMKGEALRDGEYLDVTRLFQFAAGKVPELASTVGGVQRPEVKIPSRAGQMDIGRYGNNERASINLISPRPIILNPSFQEENLYLDVRNVGNQLDSKMRKISKEKDNEFIFLSSGNFSGAYEIRGRYLELNNKYLIKVRVFKNLNLVGEISLEDSDIDALMSRTAEECLTIIQRDFDSD